MKTKLEHNQRNINKWLQERAKMEFAIGQLKDVPEHKDQIESIQKRIDKCNDVLKQYAEWNKGLQDRTVLINPAGKPDEVKVIKRSLISLPKKEQRRLGILPPVVTNK